MFFLDVNPDQNHIPGHANGFDGQGSHHLNLVRDNHVRSSDPPSFINQPSHQYLPSLNSTTSHASVPVAPAPVAPAPVPPPPATPLKHNAALPPQAPK